MSAPALPDEPEQVDPEDTTEDTAEDTTADTTATTPFGRRVTSRKFIAYVVGMSLSVWFLLGDQMKASTWTTFALYLTAIYTLGNVGEKGVSTLFTSINPRTR